MWIQSRVGFFSIVSKPGDAALHRLTVRARVESDLVALRERYLPELGAVQCSRNNDYSHRARAHQDAVAQALARMAMDIDYSNFKQVVAQEQGAQRAHIYGRVWGELYQLQNNDQGEASV